MASGSCQPGERGAAGKRRRRVFWWILVFLAGLCAVIALLVLVSYKTFQHLYAQAPDPLFTYHVDPTLKAQIQDRVPVDVTVDRTVPVRLTKVLAVEIPLREALEVLIDDDFTLPVDATFHLPIDQEVYVEADVPVETRIPLDGLRVQTTLWGFKKITLPLSGSLPVKTTIPLRETIRVKTEARIRLQEEVTVHVTKRLALPLDLTLKVNLPIDDVFDIRFTEPLRVTAHVPNEIPVDVRLRFSLSKEEGLITE